MSLLKLLRYFLYVSLWTESPSMLALDRQGNVNINVLITSLVITTNLHSDSSLVGRLSSDYSGKTRYIITIILSLYFIYVVDNHSLWR